MREPVEKVIDGDTYTFCQMSPKQSLKLLTRIVKIVGPTIGAAVDGAKIGGMDIAAVIEQEMDISKIVSALCDRLDENEVEAIVDGLLSQVIHSGQGEVSKRFDVIFGGRLPHLFKVLGEAIKVEYGDFLAGLPDLSTIAAGTGMIRGRST